MSGFNENDIVYLPIEPGQTVDNFRPFIVGTRKVIKLNYSEYSVVCATCGGGGILRTESESKQSEQRSP